MLCLETLEHVTDEAASVAELARVLRPGGRLVLSVPHDFLNFLDPVNRKHTFKPIVRLWWRFRGKQSLDFSKEYSHRHYSLEKLRATLKGFRVERAHQTALFLS